MGQIASTINGVAQTVQQTSAAVQNTSATPADLTGASEKLREPVAVVPVLSRSRRRRPHYRAIRWP